MKPRSLDATVLDGALVERATACTKVTRDTENAMWWTQPVSVGVRRLAGARSRR